MNKAEVLFEKLASLASSNYIPMHILESPNPPTVDDLTHYRNYLYNKAEEKPTNPFKAVGFGSLMGAIPGATLGAAAGSLAGNTRVGAIVGGSLGIAAGGFLSYLLSLVDKQQIEEARLILSSADISDAEKRQLAIEIERWQQVKYIRDKFKDKTVLSNK